MNDRAVSLLDQYDIEVIRTRKGRGAILCESRQGLYILKEFAGPKEKAELCSLLVNKINSAGGVPAETILRNKEGELTTTDSMGVTYIVKSWFEGRECNIKDAAECQRAVQTLAKLHHRMSLEGEPVIEKLPVFSLQKEMERHNRELKRVRRFLKGKSQKTEFELFLNQHFDFFLLQAAEILEDWSSYEKQTDSELIKQQGTFCHGDYQYHNIIMSEAEMSVINFEKCMMDDPVRDLSLFMRKLLEKSNWSKDLGMRILESYDKERPLSAKSRISLYYRLAYPEKFWKIVNFYFNSGKAWIPGKNMEKLKKLLEQEKEKQEFLTDVFRTL